MTQEKLKRYPKLTSRIRTLEEELRHLRATGTSTVPHYGAVGGGSGVGDPVAEATFRILEKEKELAAVKREIKEIDSYIEGVTDELVQSAMWHHFILDRSWRATAMRLGGKNTKASVRMAVTRYVKEHP